MTERYLVVDHLRFSYEGLFNLTELYTIIPAWFYDKGYDWYEKMNQELVTSTGKQFKLIFEPWKNVSDYNKLVINIHLNMIDVKEVEVQHDNKTINLSQGLIRMTFDAYVVSDRFDRLSKKPLLWLLSVLADKYFYRSYFSRYETWIKSDVDDLHEKIKNYLNVYKYQYQT